MALALNATPLISLDAVVVDTETTGLDPRQAQIIEIAGLRLTLGRLDEDQTFHSFVRPPVLIPASATAIHGIDDGKVARAPRFEEVWPRFQAFIADKTLIGHTLGFDLAVLARECERIGQDFAFQRTLDTRLLAQVVEPNLAGYSLERLATWLGVELAQRHSAAGDALTTARIFRALVPKLRERGIRTLAEAMTACRALTDALEAQHRAGWPEPAAPASDEQPVLGHIDTYPYRHCVGEIMARPVQFMTRQENMAAALKTMMAHRISSVYVVADSTGETARVRAPDTGILTERDVLRAVAEQGAHALQRPIAEFMSAPLATIPADAFVYRAIGRMARLKIRHLGVVDEIGFVVGALSARDLLRLRAQEVVTLGDEIDQATDVHALGKAWATLPQVAASLRAEDVPARDIAAVISREVGALTRQAAVIAEHRMQEAGRGAPPCSYAVAVLGSAGRGESLLAMDQDNALVFAEGAPDGDADRWFAMLATHIADILDEAGVPYCKGGVMAKNSQWRGSLATWHARIDDWVSRSRPEDLLFVDIFFDLRGVHGDFSLADNIWRYAFAATKDNAAFAKALVEAAGETQDAIGWFGNIKTHAGRVDLKKTGLFGIVTSARALAVRHHILERATPARLTGIKALGIGAAEDLDALVQAHQSFLKFILGQQLEDLEQGRAPANTVAVRSLSRADQHRLRDAFGAVQHVDTMTRDLLFSG